MCFMMLVVKFVQAAVMTCLLAKDMGGLFANL